MQVSKTWYPLLDVLRGPAALLVFAEHWRNFFFQDFAQVKNPGIALKVFYIVTGAGHEAVMVFFVLSGCVIAHVFYGMNASNSWGWPTYLAARLTRLWIVLVPALVLAFLWDTLGMWLAGSDDPVYSGAGFGNMVNVSVAETSTLWIFVGNVFFGQKIFVPAFGSLWPSWSIAYEFMYYLVYPALALALIPAMGRSWPVRIGYLLLASGVLVFAGGRIAMSFPIWLAGAAAYLCFRRAPIQERFATLGFSVGLLLTLACIVGSRSGKVIPYVNWDWLIAIACGLAIYCGLGANPGKLTSRLLKPLHQLSAVSYSLYLYHMPVLLFAAALTFTNSSERWAPSVPNLLLGSLLALVVFAYCLAGWYFTERNTGVIRKWSAKHFGV
jgi:peptidoglycan/LPS O-acetylase OafA/YrhL